jgi:hypothetical protein
MTENYLILRLLTLNEYESLNIIATSFDYDFQDGDAGEILLNKLLIPSVISITHDDKTTFLDNLTETNYKFFHDDYIIGVEIDEENSLIIPLEERSWIVFGKKAK